MKHIALSCLSIGLLFCQRASADLSLETESARILAPGKVEVSAAAEFQTSNSNGDEFALPLAIEIGVLPRLEILIEPVALVIINPENGEKTDGIGDTEITANTWHLMSGSSCPLSPLVWNGKYPRRASWTLAPGSPTSRSTSLVVSASAISM